MDGLSWQLGGRQRDRAVLPPSLWAPPLTDPQALICLLVTAGAQRRDSSSVFLSAELLMILEPDFPFLAALLRTKPGLGWRGFRQDSSMSSADLFDEQRKQTAGNRLGQAGGRRASPHRPSVFSAQDFSPFQDCWPVFDAARASKGRS